MSQRNLSRRQFLARAGVGAGALAGAGLAASHASGASHTAGAPSAADVPAAQDHRHEPPSSVAAQDWSSATNFMFFNTPQGRTVDAIASRMIPTDDLGPGAHEAGVVFYIDRALAGPYMVQQEIYRAGLAALDAYSQATFGGLFRNLEPEQQDTILRDVEAGRASTFTAPTAQGFFNLLWLHVREGMFSDPAHGGNRDFIGWRLLRHPGVQWENAADVQWNGPATTTPMRAIADWGWRL